MSISEQLPIAEPMTRQGTQRLFRPDPRSCDLREDHHRVMFAAYPLPPAKVLVTVHGDIDATTCSALADYVERQIAGAHRLVLDLQNVEFFAASGFAALSNVNVICARAGVDWTLLAEAHIRRLLGICDPARELPVVQNCSADKYLRARPGDGKFLVGGNDEHRRR